MVPFLMPEAQPASVLDTVVVPVPVPPPAVAPVPPVRPQGDNNGNADQALYRHMGTQVRYVCMIQGAGRSVPPEVLRPGGLQQCFSQLRESRLRASMWHGCDGYALCRSLDLTCEVPAGQLGWLQ